MKGRTIPLLGATPFAASRVESEFLIGPLGLDGLLILKSSILPNILQVHVRNSSILYRALS